MKTHKYVIFSIKDLTCDTQHYRQSQAFIDKTHYDSCPRKEDGLPNVIKH